uniref:Uncharacterized protein n=1 Tax=Romanomermis culicivorax TaxID=13658 RepID=A0A915JCY9_ROMCU
SGIASKARHRKQCFFKTFWLEYKRKFGPCLYRFKQFSAHPMQLLMIDHDVLTIWLAKEFSYFTNE